MNHAVKIHRPRNGVAVIKLNRPERLNAVSFALVDDLHEALDRWTRTRPVMSSCSRGEGRGFCSGIDLKAIGAAKTLATVLHLHQGTPYVYQGDELGMANAPFAAIGDFRDIETLNYYAQAAERGDVDLATLLAAMLKMSRDQGRTPVQWDASPNAGFTTGTPWLAVNPDYVTVNAAAEVGQPGSVFEHYRTLIELRHADPVITDGDFELLLPDHPTIWAFLRRGPDTELLVAANFSADVTAAALPLDPEWVGAAVVLTNLPDQDPLQPPPDLKLRAWESVIWRRTK